TAAPGRAARPRPRWTCSSPRRRPARPWSAGPAPSFPLPASLRPPLGELQRPAEGLDPRDVAAQDLQPARVLQLPRGLLQPQLPGGLLQLLLFLGELIHALLGEGLALFLLHQIAPSECRVTNRVRRPILSAASDSASRADASSRPSIS